MRYSANRQTIVQTLKTKNVLPTSKKAKDLCQAKLCAIK